MNYFDVIKSKHVTFSVMRPQHSIVMTYFHPSQQN